MRARKAAATALLLVAAFALGACQSTAPIPVPKAEQVIGTWTHGTSVLRLEYNRTFTLTDIPEGVVRQTSVLTAHTQPKGPLIDIDGTWKIGSGGNDAGGAPAVQLDFFKPPKVSTFSGLTLLVEGYTDSSRQLYVDLGDPDAHIEYAYTRK